MIKYKMELTFTEDLLGTVPKSKTIYADYVQGPALEARPELADSDDFASELDTVPEDLEEKGWTGFHTVNDKPILYAYVLKGFMKDACGMLRRVKGTKSSQLTAYKQVIDGVVFVAPNRIPLNLNGEEMGVSERPLRAATAQGPRVALARSDTCPVGTTLEFTLVTLGELKPPKGKTAKTAPSLDELLVEWFDYGMLRGLGQWRNANWGSFTYTMERLTD